MGKFNALAKFLGLSAKEYGDDAAKILEKVDTPEFAVSLKGKPRTEYLKALDEVYGDQAKRAADMGFGPETYYHGTKKKFDQFKPSHGGSAGKSVYLTENKNVAERYRPENGAMFKGRVRNDNILDLTVNNDIGLKNIEAAADKLGIRDELDKMKFKGGNAYYDLMRAYENKNPSAFEGLIGNQRENAFTEKVKEITGAKGFKFSQNGIENYSTNIFDPKDIRSHKAAFDPRFKESSLLLAGGLAGQQLPEVDISPLPFLKKGVDAYNSAKESVIEPVARSMNFGNDPQFQKVAEGALNIVADPINYASGPVGAGLTGLQVMGELTPEKKAKLKALDRLAGE